MIRGGAVVVHVADVAVAVRFYIETLGMKLVEERPVESVIDAGEGFLLALRAGAARLRAPATSSFERRSRSPRRSRSTRTAVSSSMRRAGSRTRTATPSPLVGSDP